MQVDLDTVRLLGAGLTHARRHPCGLSVRAALAVLSCMLLLGHSMQLVHGSTAGAAFGTEAAPSSCTAPQVDMSKDMFKCVMWRKACVDQGVIVSFDPEVHPTSSERLVPQLNVTMVMYNLPSEYGIGDRYKGGSSLRFPPLYVRHGNYLEEAPDLQKPTFSTCTVPLLVYAHYPFNAAETFRYSFDKLHHLQQAGFFDRGVTLVPGVPPGIRVPSYTKFWLGSLTDRAVVSLSELSARLPPGSPSNATGEGAHVRCFERLVGCRLVYNGVGMQYYRTAQQVVRHYLPQAEPRARDYEAMLLRDYQVRLPADPSVFKLVFVSRNLHHSSVGRTILNEPELLAACNGAQGADLPPDSWKVPYRRFFCFSFLFGKDPLMDVWLMQRVDGIAGLHGAGLTNALYQRPGGSVLEIRPYGFSGRQSWANRYMRFKASSPNEKPWQIFWYGIDTFNASLSEPGMFEKEALPHYTQFRTVLARDRHVRVTWPSLRHQLLNMAAVARSHDRYMALRLNSMYYVTDAAQPALRLGEDDSLDRGQQRPPFVDAEAEWAAAARLPLPRAHAAAAQQAA